LKTFSEISKDSDFLVAWLLALFAFDFIKL